MPNALRERPGSPTTCPAKCDQGFRKTRPRESPLTGPYEGRLSICERTADYGATR